MTLTTATLLPGLILIALGALFLVPHPAVVSSLKRLPRSRTAALIFFGLGAAWFLYRVWHLSEADFGQYRRALFIFFTAVAVGAFVYVPDFLAVRGLAILVLLGAMPLLDAAYMEYEQPQRLVMVSVVYVAIALAIYLGASPFRLRDIFEWLYRQPARARLLGGGLAACGLALTIVAFTY
jgi:hypothetical protein